MVADPKIESQIQSHVAEEDTVFEVSVYAAATPRTPRVRADA